MVDSLNNKMFNIPKNIIITIIFLLMVPLKNLYSYINMDGNMTQKNHPQFAWITENNKLKVILRNDAKVEIQDLHLANHLKRPVKIKSFHQEGNKLFIETLDDLDFTRPWNYVVSINWKDVYAYFSREVLDKYFYSNLPLGPEIINGNLILTIWSPPATNITVYFYDDTNHKRLLLKKDMVRRDEGLWSLKLTPAQLNTNDLHGYFYALEVTAMGKTHFALDPYAKSMAAFNPYENDIEKMAIIDLDRTNPPNYQSSKKFNSDLISNPMKYIGYEMHIRDFTIDPHLNIPEKEKGTYIGVTKIIPHIKNLGVTHVQLLPIQSFYTTDENNRKFQGPDAPSKQINYNWGYDSHQFFTPEGWYSTDASNPITRIKELKTMVSTFHENGIGVVMDVVYNHLFKAATFKNLAPGCYFRTDDMGVVSHKTGAGVSLESRTKMVRRLIVDSLKYFSDEFHINGFRFDLMGFMDHQTMHEIRQALGPDAILYGEAWEFTDLPKEIATTKSNLPFNDVLSAFNDSSRDAYTGRMSSSGFIQGAYHEGPKARAGIIGAIKNYPLDYNNDGFPDVFMSENEYDQFAETPENTLNFLTIHDGFTLFDKINLSTPGDIEYKKQLIKMGISMLFTSQGKVIIHGGCEMGRSKPLAKNDPTRKRAHTSEHVIPQDGVTYFHENSYQSPDITNMINWSRKNNFDDIFQYTKGLIQLRKEIPSLRYQQAQSIRNGLRFLNEVIPDNMMNPSFFERGFDQLENMKIKFINGPKNQRYYIVGEVHHHEGEDKNPLDNQYFIDFDQNGTGSIEFSKEQIAKFDIHAWANPKSLDIKLVKTPGKWDSPEGAYTDTGNNIIKPEALLDDNSAIINLSIIDHTAGRGNFNHNHFIAYSLENRLEDSDAKYEKVYVIHNADTSAVKLKVPEIKNFKHCDILADGNRAGTINLICSQVSIKDTIIEVPSKTSTIIGCYN